MRWGNDEGETNTSGPWVVGPRIHGRRYTGIMPFNNSPLRGQRRIRERLDDFPCEDDRPREELAGWFVIKAANPNPTADSTPHPLKEIPNPAPATDRVSLGLGIHPHWANAAAQCVNANSGKVGDSYRWTVVFASSPAAAEELSNANDIEWFTAVASSAFGRLTTGDPDLRHLPKAKSKVKPPRYEPREQIEALAATSKRAELFLAPAAQHVDALKAYARAKGTSYAELLKTCGVPSELINE